MAGMIRDGVDDSSVVTVYNPVSPFAEQTIVSRLVGACLDELAKREGGRMFMLVEFRSEFWFVLVQCVVDERLETQVVIPR